jgi:hypothetical protein
VGYDSVILVLRFDADGSHPVVSNYCREGETWGLLFTDSDDPTDWRDLLDIF